MMATVTPVRDPGVFSNKVKQWANDDGMIEHSQRRTACPPNFKSKPGRFHHHGHHRSRRNTSPSIAEKSHKKRPKIDIAFLSSCKNNEEVLLRAVISQRVTPETINQQDESGKTGLSYVCTNGNLEMLKILCSIPNVDVNLADREGNTPLMIAAQAGHVDILSTLLKNYKDSLILDQRNLMGFTCLMKASLQGRVKCVKLLLLAGASPWLTDHGRGYFALQWAKYCGRHSCAEVIEKFLKSTNQKQPPVIRKKNMKQKIALGKSSSEPDLLNVVKQDGADLNSSNTETDQNFNQCNVASSGSNENKNWLKRGFKRAFQRKSNDMKVLGNITGVGMVAAASGGIISNNMASNKVNTTGGKSEQKLSARVVPKVEITNSNMT